MTPRMVRRLSAARWGMTGVILSLACGSAVAGSTSAILWHVSPRSLAVESPEDLYVPAGRLEGDWRLDWSVPYQRLEELERLLPAGRVGASTPLKLDVRLGPVSHARVRAEAVSPAYFDAYRPSVTSGRMLVPSDQGADACVISASLVEDLTLAGLETNRLALAGGGSCIVVGSVSAEFAALRSGTAVWFPVRSVLSRLPEGSLSNEGIEIFDLVFRLSRAEDRGLAESVLNQTATWPPASGDRLRDARTPSLLPLPESRFSPREWSGIRWALLAALLTLLLSVVNAFRLMGVMSRDWTSDIGIRLAYGSSRFRVVWRSLSTGTAIGLAAAAVGIALTAACSYAIDSFGAARYIAQGLVFQPRDYAAAILFSLSVAAAGTMAATAARARGSIVVLLRGADSDVTRGGWTGKHISLNVLVYSAVVHILMLGALTALRGLNSTLAIDLGFEPSNVVAVRLARVADAAEPQRLAEAANLLEIARAQPQVEAVALATDSPFVRYGDGPLATEGRAFALRDGRRFLGTDARVGHLTPGVRYVSPGFFALLGIPLVTGRIFENREATGVNSPVVVSRNFTRVLTGGDPVGQLVNFGRLRGVASYSEPWREIVGVVGDLRYRRLFEPARPEVFLPFAHHAPSEFYVVAKTTMRSTRTVTSLTDALLQAEPAYALVVDGDLESIVREAGAGIRFVATAGVLFALLSAVLVVVGISAIVAQMIRASWREIAIRVAVGAGPRRLGWELGGRYGAASVAGSFGGMACGAQIMDLLRHVALDASPGAGFLYGTMVSVVSLCIVCGAIAVPLRQGFRTDVRRALQAVP